MRWWLLAGGLVVVAVVGVVAAGGSDVGEIDRPTFVFDAPPGMLMARYYALYRGNVSMPEGTGFRGVSSHRDVLSYVNEADGPVLAELDASLLDEVERDVTLLPYTLRPSTAPAAIRVDDGRPLRLLSEGDVTIAVNTDRSFGLALLAGLEANGVGLNDIEIIEASDSVASGLKRMDVIDGQVGWFRVSLDAFNDSLSLRELYERVNRSVPPRYVFVAAGGLSSEQARSMLAAYNRSIMFGSRHGEEIYEAYNRRTGLLLRPIEGLGGIERQHIDRDRIRDVYDIEDRVP